MPWVFCGMGCSCFALLGIALVMLPSGPLDKEVLYGLGYITALGSGLCLLGYIGRIALALEELVKKQ